MRGKRHSGWAYHCARRIIPAHAGQTLRRHPPRRLTPDHPRACGANAGTCFTSCASVGSSPRMRGKRCDPSPRRRPRRIIPAHAGQTSQLEHSVYSPADHPRACGANVSSDGMLSRCTGSSPRMRGKPALHSRAGVGHRIIPAHAGQTSMVVSASVLSSDHPRACGANQQGGYPRWYPPGSSPRMRGKRVRGPCGSYRLRIIPAHAGQTSGVIQWTKTATDHPRACGANHAARFELADTLGSSPRMRGKQRVRWPLVRAGRIIPAHAGQTVRFYAKTLERWTLNNWIRTVAPIFVLLFLPPVIGQNAYIERHYSNQSFSWFSKLHYASAFDLSLVA